MIFVGDFHQLPPVSRGPVQVPFAFESAAWRGVSPTVVELTEVFRQADLEHVALLHEVRLGQPGPEVGALLRKRCSRLSPAADGVLPTWLYCTRTNVKAENTKHFNKLSAAARTYRSSDTVTSQAGEDWFASLDKDLQCSKNLGLKIDAQVMLLANVDFNERLANGSRGVDVNKRMANGSRGVVIRFTDPGSERGAQRNRAFLEDAKNAKLGRGGTENKHWTHVESHAEPPGDLKVICCCAVRCTSLP